MANLKPETLRIIVWAGVADIFIGVGMAIAMLQGVFGPDMELVALVGVPVALWGVVLILWGRNKLSQADNRRGDLN